MKGRGGLLVLNNSTFLGSPVNIHVYIDQKNLKTTLLECFIITNGVKLCTRV